MTAQQIVDKIRFITQTDSNDATDAQILRMINDGISSQIEFVSNLRQDFLLKQGTSINLVNGTSDYTLATDILQLKKVTVALDGTNQYVAYEKDLNEITDLVNAGTLEAMSSPKYTKLTQTDATKFDIRISPYPTVNVTAGLQYWYIARPAAVTISDTPVTPPEIHPALVQYVVREMKQRMGDTAGMRLADSLVSNMHEEYKRQVGTRNIDIWTGFESPPFYE